MCQALYKLRATPAKMRSLRIQRDIKLCERIKIRRETTVPRSLLLSGRSRATIAVKLLRGSAARIIKGLFRNSVVPDNRPLLMYPVVPSDRMLLR